MCVGHMFFFPVGLASSCRWGCDPRARDWPVEEKDGGSVPQVSAHLLWSPVPFSQRQHLCSVAWNSSWEALCPLQPSPRASWCSGVALVTAQTWVPMAFEG